MTSFKQVKNNARTHISPNEINNTTSPITIGVVNGEGERFPTVTTGYWVTIYDDVTYTDPYDDPQMEIALVTGKTGDTFTMTRSQLNTTAKSHSGSPAMKLLIVDQQINDIQTAINTLETATPPSSVSVTTKGDLQTYSTTPDRLPVGVNGQILESRSTEATGLKWIDLPSTDSITITAAPSSDVTTSGMKIQLTAASNLAFGDVCYIASTGKATLIDADAIASMSGLVMASETINQDATGTFLLLGVARNDAWNWTVGGLIYGTVTGTSGNTLSQTAPTGTDDVVQILGIATHADRMLFNPQLVQTELV